MASSTRLEKLEYKEILTPSWREVRNSLMQQQQQEDVGVEKRQDGTPVREAGTPVRENGGPGLEQRSALESPANREASEEMQWSNEEGSSEDCTNQAYATRHDRCELTEKKRFLNFISGGQRKRSRPQSMTLLDSPCLISPPLPPRRLTIASPTPTHAETEQLVHPEVLPWQPRVFPLNSTEEDLLYHPPPPPPLPPLPSVFMTSLTQPSPSSPRHTFTPSQTPSCSSSALVTPVGSPRSTPSEENPAISPAEWIVNSQLPATHHNHRTLGIAESALMASPVPHNPIILKLTKKI